MGILARGKGQNGILMTQQTQHQVMVNAMIQYQMA
jgi:hypothetical protein